MNENEMINQNNVSGDDNPAEGTEKDYLAAIKQLKETMVPRETYEKLYSDHKNLLDAYIEGREIPEIEYGVEKTYIDELRKELYGEDCELSNLEYVKKSLELRDAIIERGGQDPFLPIGSHVPITPGMIEKAENTATILRECVEFADGDSGIFTAELQRRTNETPNFKKTR